MLLWSHKLVTVIMCVSTCRTGENFSCTRSLRQLLRLVLLAVVISTSVLNAEAAAMPKNDDGSANVRVRRSTCETNSMPEACRLELDECDGIPNNMTFQPCRAATIQILGGIIAQALMNCTERNRLRRLVRNRIAVIDDERGIPEFDDIFTWARHILGRQEPFHQFFAHNDTGRALRWLEATEPRKALLFVDSTKKSEIDHGRVKEFVRRGGTVVTRGHAFDITKSLYPHILSTEPSQALRTQQQHGRVRVQIKKANFRRNGSHPQFSRGTCAGDSRLFNVWDWFSVQKPSGLTWQYETDTFLVRRPDDGQQLAYYSLLKVAKRYSFPRRLEAMLCFDIGQGSVFHITGNLHQHYHPLNVKAWRSKHWRIPSSFKRLIRVHKKTLRQAWRNYVGNYRSRQSHKPLREIHYLLETLKVSEKELLTAAANTDIVLRLLLQSWRVENHDSSNDTECS